MRTCRSGTEKTRIYEVPSVPSKESHMHAGKATNETPKDLDSDLPPHKFSKVI